MDPKLDNFWTSFGTILEPILEPKMHQQIDQKWDSFWTKKGGPGSLCRWTTAGSRGTPIATGSELIRANYTNVDPKYVLKGFNESYYYYYYY